MKPAVDAQKPPGGGLCAYFLHSVLVGVTGFELAPCVPKAKKVVVFSSSAKALIGLISTHSTLSIEATGFFRLPICDTYPHSDTNKKQHCHITEYRLPITRCHKAPIF